MMNVRPLLLGALLLLPPVVCAQGETASGEGAEIAAGVALHRSLFSSDADGGVACYRIPALVTAPNGDLLAAIDERVPSCADLRGNRDINIVLRRSSDGGETWSAMETVADFPPGQSASDPSMIVDRETGAVFLFYNFMDLDAAPDRYRLHVMTSTDDGATWSGPEDLTPQITKPTWRDDFMFITSGRGIQTQDGRLLHTLVNLDRGVYVFGSDDHGATWHLIDAPIQPADESKLVELAGGAWMVNSRVNEAGLRWVHVSEDEGRTWTSRPDSALIDPGVNASILRYPSTDGAKGPLLFINTASADARENLTIRVSHDEGRTWTEGTVLYPAAAAYPSMTMLDGGDVGVLFETDDYRETVFMRFPLGWIVGEAERPGRTP